MIGIYFFLVFFNIAGEFLVNLAGFIIPAYYSLNALFTAGTADDTQVSLPTFPLTSLMTLTLVLGADSSVFSG